VHISFVRSVTMDSWSDPQVGTWHTRLTPHTPLTCPPEKNNQAPNSCTTHPHTERLSN